MSESLPRKGVFPGERTFIKTDLSLLENALDPGKENMYFKKAGGISGMIPRAIP
jgi:hypothetical protein